LIICLLHFLFANSFELMMMMMMLIIIIIIIIFPYCYSAYGQPSILFHGQYTISTEEGSQQGDPVGPLLFCNTIQPLLSSLDSDVKLGFLDDVTLGGPVDMSRLMLLG